jgi:glycosyltransferase involved in cell wall biosynthesis
MDNPKIPYVSIIIPCYNEVDYIGSCLNSILENDYPKDKFEIIVIDGISNDGTREILSGFQKNNSQISVLDNQKKEQQFALNIGIQNARGEIIIRMDGHSTYKFNYISECIYALQHYKADNVGGRWVVVPRDDSLIGHAICHAVSSFFGVGNAYYRLNSLKEKGRPVLTKPRWEINVAYFCCRKEIFEKIGLFNENLDRSEDIDFRSRLKEGGFKTLFVPEIECRYFMRTNYISFLKHMYSNGFWVINPLNYTERVSFSFRHIVPFLFIFLNMLVMIMATFSSFFSGVLIVTIAVYMSANLYYSFRISKREKDRRFIIVLPFIFISLHIFYGLGSLTGIAKLLLKKWQAAIQKIR